jgi:hypothetical protein
MMMRNFCQQLARNEDGLAAEFALVVPLLLIFILGTIDVGLYAYRINQAEKATQIGARWAAVTDPLAEEIASATYTNVTVGTVQILQGERVPAGALGLLTCTNTACTCTTAPCPGTTFDSDAFDLMSARMKDILPAIKDENIVLEYRGSGLGFAGNPNGPDLSPLITVRLINMSHQSVVLSPLGVSTSLPDFAYSLTAEDMRGTIAN